MSTVKVDIVADAQKFEAAVKRAEKAAQSLSGELDKTDKAVKSVGESLDDTASKGRGVADLADGVATLFGADQLQAVTDWGRGIADTADGLKETFGPAIEKATAKVKALSASMTATPWGKFKLGAGLAVAAGLAFASQTEAGGDILDRVYDQALKNANKTLSVFGDTIQWADKHTGGFGQKLLNLTGWFKKTDEAAQASSQRLAQWAAQAQWAAKQIAIANQLGGTVDDPDGAFASQAWIDSNSGQAAIVAAMESRSEKVGSAATKAVEKVTNKAKEAFDKALPKLKAASDKFNDAVSMRDSIRGGFGLDFSDDIGHNVTESLSRQVAAWKQFVSKIGQLRKMGLPESLVRQFVEAGPGSLGELDRINSGNIKDIAKLYKQGMGIANDFSATETLRQTGVNVNKPVKVTLNVTGTEKEFVSMVKKWVRVEGGGNVQVAFGK